MKCVAVLSAMVAMILSGCGQAPSTSSGGNTPVPWTPQYAYVINLADSTLSQYSMAADGSLAPLSTPTIATGSAPMAIAADLTGRYVYVSNTGDSTISQYSVNPDGTLNPTSSPIASDLFPTELILSPNGDFLYSVNSGGSISQYSIGADGSLTWISIVSIGGFYLQGITFSPSGNFAYVVDVGAQALYPFSVAATGALSPLSPASIPLPGCPSGPVAAASVSGGEFLYVLGCLPNEIEVFSIGSDGSLVATSAVPTGNSPEGMIISGSTIYVTNLQDATVSTFAR